MSRNDCHALIVLETKYCKFWKGHGSHDGRSTASWLFAIESSISKLFIGPLEGTTERSVLDRGMIVKPVLQTLGVAVPLKQCHLHILFISNSNGKFDTRLCCSSVTSQPLPLSLRRWLALQNAYSLDSCYPGVLRFHRSFVAGRNRDTG
jgi:hypothetical protein